jgi:disease resistance protein RPM1
MDSATAGTIQTLIKRLAGEIQEGRTLQKELKNDLGDIKKELESINGSFKQSWKANNIRSNDVVPELWVQEIQELAYDMEDCLDLHRRPSTLPRLLLRPAKTLENRTRFAEEIKRLKQRVKDANQRKSVYAMGAPPLPPSPSVFVPVGDLVGMDKLNKEVLDLLQLQREACNGGERQLKTQPLKVVCIVGPRGLGKTTLARVVYESLDHDEFDCRAWVYAPECADGRGGLLRKVLEEVNRPVAVGTSSKVISGDSELVISLRTCLRSKRR